MPNLHFHDLVLPPLCLAHLLFCLLSLLKTITQDYITWKLSIIQKIPRETATSYKACHPGS